MTERIGITLAADAGPLKKTLDETNAKLQKTKDLLTKHGGKPRMEEEAKAVERGVRVAEKAVLGLDRQYKELVKTVRSLKHEMNRTVKGGGGVSSAQGDALRDAKAQLALLREGRSVARGQMSKLYGQAGIESPMEQKAKAEARSAKETERLASEKEKEKERAARDAERDREARREERAKSAAQMAARLQHVFFNRPAQMAAGFAQSLAGRVTGAGELLSSNMMAGGQLAAATGFSDRGLRSDVSRFGMSYGFTRAESYQMALQSMRASGRSGMGGRLDALSNMGMMRAYGMDLGDVTGLQTAARQAGSREGGHDLNQDLVKGMRLGEIPRLLAPEMAQAVTQLLSTSTLAQTQASGRVAAQTIGALGRMMGPSYAQSPARLASVAGGLHSAIASPGGGESGEALMLQAMGMGSEAGVDYFEARRRMQAGVSDKQNIPRMMNFLRERYGNDPKTMALGLERLSGGRMTYSAASDFVKGYDETLFNPALMDGKLALGAEAGKVKGAYGLKAREIAKGEAAALARAKADPIFETADRVLIKVLTELAGLIQSVIPYFKKLVDWLASQPFIGRFFQTKPGRQ